MSLFPSFKDLPLKRKIFLIAVAASAIPLGLSSCLILLNERLTFPGILQNELLNLASIVGDNCTAALSFNDDKTAQEVLDTLRDNPHVRSAALYDYKGRVVALYPNDTSVIAPPIQVPLRPGIGLTHEKAWIFHNVMSGTERVGFLYLESDLDEMNRRLFNTALAALGALVVSLLLSSLIANRLQRRVTEPLHQVVKKMKDIARGEGD